MIYRFLNSCRLCKPIRYRPSREVSKIDGLFIIFIFMKRKQIEAKIFYFENNFIIKLNSYKNFAKMQGENFETEFAINISEIKKILWKTEKDTFAVAFQIAMIIEERINDL